MNHKRVECSTSLPNLPTENHNVQKNCESVYLLVGMIRQLIECFLDLLLEKRLPPLLWVGILHLLHLGSEGHRIFDTFATAIKNDSTDSHTRSDVSLSLGFSDCEYFIMSP